MNGKVRSTSMTTSRNSNRRSPRKKNRTGLILMVAFVLILVGCLSVKKNVLDANTRRKEQQKIELEEKIKDLKEEKKEIEEKAAYVHTPKYIEDIAREKFGLVYKDEIIFKASE